MRVLSVPPSLKQSVNLLYLTVFLVFFEVILVRQSSWWDLPVEEMGYAGLSAFIICKCLGSVICAGKRSGFSFISVSIFGLIGAHIYYALDKQQSSLLFYSLFLLIYGLIVLRLIKREVEKSYFDPRLKWFQGLPRPIPYLSCSLISGEKKMSFQVGRLDSHGAFLFNSGSSEEDQKLLLGMTSRKKLQAFFEFRTGSLRQEQFQCGVTPISILERALGIGLEFQQNHSDKAHEISRLIETLRAKGYLE